MQRNFVQVAKFLEEHFPELRGRISGGVNPPPPFVEFLSYILTSCQVIGMVWMMLGGDKVMSFIGYPPNRTYPNWYYTIQNNPMPIGMFLFLLAPQILGKFQINGAFEIILDDNIEIYSKLATGKFPTGQYLIDTLTKVGLQPSTSSTITTSEM